MLKAFIRWGIAWSAIITCLVGIETPGVAADLETDTRRFQIEFETGAIWQGRNEIHIPDSAAGTRFSLADIQDSAPIAQRRVEVTWYPGRRHALRFVYQPLGFSGTGSFASPVLFAGGTFAPGAPVESDYKFDSYRVTYRYLFYESPAWRVSAGATAFIRDAKVELRQASSTATDSNVGFVPLLSVNVEYHFAPRWMAVVDVDGWWLRKDALSMLPRRSATISPTIGRSRRGIARLKAGWITVSGSPSAGSTSPWSQLGIGTDAAFRSEVLREVVDERPA